MAETTRRPGAGERSGAARAVTGAELVALAARIAAVPHRRPGSDAERRAAAGLADELRATGRRRRRTTRVEPLWVRPHRGVAHALVAALAVAGSVLSVAHPLVGLGLAVAALLLLAGDLSGRAPLVRRLTFERATQNVVSRDPRAAPVRLVVTAAVDAPAPGLLSRGAAGRAQARLRRLLRGRLPGPHGVLALALIALVVAAGARALGASGPLLGAAQLLPTALALLGVGAGLDQALTRTPVAGAGADAAAAAVAIALVAALDVRPPRGLAVDCVLAGAGGAHALGVRHWIAAERRAGVRPEQVVVLHVAACGSGTPVFVIREGLVFPLRAHPRLVALAREVAAARLELQLATLETRGASGARAARAAGWPAIAIGCVDEAGVVPRRGGDDDSVDRLEPAALEAAFAACLALVRALDDDLAPAEEPEGDSRAAVDDAAWAPPEGSAPGSSRATGPIR